MLQLRKKRKKTLHDCAMYKLIDCYISLEMSEDCSSDIFENQAEVEHVFYQVYSLSTEPNETGFVLHCFLDMLLKTCTLQLTALLTSKAVRLFNGNMHCSSFLMYIFLVL